MNTTEVTPTITPESTELSLADYRAMREGREVPKAIVDTTSSAADAANADAETAAELTESADPNSKEETTSQDENTKPPKKDKIAGRFSELTQKIKSLESQLAAKAGTGQSEKTESKPADVPTLPPDPNDPEPDASRFTDYVEWQKAWNRWDRRQDTRQEKAAAAAAEQQNAAKAKAQTWQTRVSEATAELADFAAVAQNPDLSVTQAMAEAITESEIGPSILYHLGKNPAEAARIAKLSPVSQVREIGKLEKALEPAAAADEDEDAPVAPPVKKPTVSKAPAPHKPLGGGASSTNPAKQIDSMTQAEYRAYRESGKLR